ncbi:MAG TPA: hypothetical protein VHK91_17105 [Flavisolibacter sp.]|jgi:hypothetical protein|nr:hypothetical protein [Flavisolibacter sp.]
MKNLLLLILSAVSFSASAQVVSGLYSGTLVNDSTKNVQRYELALSEYRDKITGYSYTTFVRNDTFYYSIKSVKATRENGQLKVEDDKMILNNFPQRPDKGVHQINYIQLTNEDTLRTANGKWQTTKTRIYYSIGGDVAMHLDNDSTRSSLIGHLKELNLISQPHYDQSVTKVKVKEDKVKIKKEPAATPVASTPVKIPYEQRTKKLQQTLVLTSDSLILSFYDNGVIDGDSISVYMNGETVLLNNRLTATATRKTVKVPDTDTIEIILVAENLGSIPPNTGLLVITDADKTYQVNFSADLQTNAAILFQRKKK